MARTSEKREIIYKPSTKDFIISLAAMPEWSKILFQNINKPYKEFLAFLIEKRFLRLNDSPIVIKKIISEYGKDNSKVNKWLSEIYHDLIALNENMPELFKTNGVRHEITYRSFDSYGGITVWLERTPRIDEGFHFDFAQAMVGKRSFYVQNVEHYLDDNEHTVYVRLLDGYGNRYRELLLERALFYNKISITDLLNKNPYQLDEDLRLHYPR